MRFLMKHTASLLLIAASALCLAVPSHAGEVHSLEQMKKEYRRPASIPFPEDNPFSVEKQRLGQPPVSGGYSLFGPNAALGPAAVFRPALVRKQQYFRRHLP